jgi:hypothetical protein
VCARKLHTVQINPIYNPLIFLALRQQSLFLSG